MGWHHDAFLLFRSLFTREKIVDFSLQRVSDRLAVVNRARTRLLFFMIKESSESTLAPFRLFNLPDVLSSFRTFIGTVSRETAHIVLLLCSAGHRFRFFSRPALRCPLCNQGSWLTDHLMTCAFVEPLLARNNISLAAFRRCMAEGAWKDLLFILHEVMLIWKNSFDDCAIDDLYLISMLTDANSI
jgi:hypothetical protein